MNIFRGKTIFQLLKVSKNIGILHKAKNIFSKGGLKTLYFSFVHSYLNYGNIAWGNTTQTKLKKLVNKDRLLEQFMLQNILGEKRKK